MILSAVELGSSTALYVDSLDTFSANANFSVAKDQPPIVSLPLVYGMGFVTAIYRGCTPQVQSSVFFNKFVNMGTINGGLTEKYKVTLENGFQWIIYRTYDASVAQTRKPLNKISNSILQGDNGFRGYIQIAKVPKDLPDNVYDQTAGAYVISGQVVGGRDGALIRYQFQWRKAGLDNPAFMFALPHHLYSFDPSMNSMKSSVELWTITKGKATGILADQWKLIEQSYANLDFAPYDPTRGSVQKMSQDAQAQVIWAGGIESEQDVQAQCCLDSMYFSGKGQSVFEFNNLANAYSLDRHGKICNDGNRL
jgi:endo-1,3(4)-beta-glucanase